MQEREKKAEEDRANRFENNKRKASQKEFNKKLGDNKTIEDVIERDYLVDIDGHVATKELLELGRGPLNDEYPAELYHENIWQTGYVKPEKIMVYDNPQDVEYVAKGIEEFEADPLKSTWDAHNFTDEKQYKKFFYIYGRWGKESAMDYFTNHIVREDGYQQRISNDRRWKKDYQFAKENPQASVIKSFFGELIKDVAAVGGDNKNLTSIAGTIQQSNIGRVDSTNNVVSRFLVEYIANPATAILILV